jgi:hypothetical protein
MTGIEIALSLALAGSSVADGRSTMTALHNCGTSCVEANPIMRGNRLWVMQAVTTGGTITLGHALKGKTKVWWLPIVSGIAWHVVAATHNSRLNVPGQR